MYDILQKYQSEFKANFKIIKDVLGSSAREHTSDIAAFISDKIALFATIVAAATFDEEEETNRHISIRKADNATHKLVVAITRLFTVC